MTNLHSLLTRVEAATGPDRELDAHIMCALNGYTMHEDSNPNDGIFAFWDGAPWKSTCHNCTIWPSPTASLDAALALVGEKLPGWDWSIHCDNGRAIAGIQPPSEDGCDLADCEAATPALAICTAILRALIAKQEVEDAEG